MNQFVDVFIQEARELIDELESSLLVLESTPDDVTALDSVFRVMHTLKGNAKMFGYDSIGQLTHQLENIYDSIRSNKNSVDFETLSITLKSVDHLRNLLQDQDLEDLSNRSIQEELLAGIHAVINGHESTETTKNTDLKAKTSKDQNISTYYIAFHPDENIMCNGTNPIYILEDLKELGKAKIHAHKKNIPDFPQLDPVKCYVFWEIYLVSNCDISEIKDVFLFVEDCAKITIHKVADEDLLDNDAFVKKIEDVRQKEVTINIDELQQYVNHLLQIIREKSIEETNINETKNQKISNIRVATDKIDNLMNLVSELVTSQARLSNISDEINIPGLTAISENIEKLSRQLRDNVFSVSLIPVNHLLMRFRRMVRDLSLELGKEVNFVVEGGETELDKNLIDVLNDPIMHILRNCLDHGIESADARVKAGKSKTGKITLKSFYSGAQVVIKITDDGAGLDYKKIHQKAIEKNLIKSSDPLDDKQLANLLFLPGFSTAGHVTDVSGRGVGMDIVKKKIEDLRGEVSIDSVKGKGTSITIKLPLTLSIIDGLRVSINRTSYIIQLSMVNKITVVTTQAVNESFNDLLIIDSEQIQFVNLRSDFECEKYEKKYTQVVVVEYEGLKVGIVVDEVIGQIQAVIKPLGKMYKDQEFLSGATILGDGTVALILDTNKLISQSIN